MILSFFSFKVTSLAVLKSLPSALQNSKMYSPVALNRKLFMVLCQLELFTPVRVWLASSHDQTRQYTPSGTDTVYCPLAMGICVVEMYFLLSTHGNLVSVSTSVFFKA